MSKKPQIDLSKCKVGQKVRLSDEELGEIGARAANKAMVEDSDRSGALTVDEMRRAEYAGDKSGRTAFAAAVAAEVRRETPWGVNGESQEEWMTRQREKASAQEKEVETLRAELAKRDERLALLMPKPCSVKPSEDDGDSERRVFMLWSDGSSGLFELESVRPSDDAFWLPGNLARIAPELLPKVETPEEIERREFEAWWKKESENVEYPISHQVIAEKAWQAARAGKEGK